MGKGAAPNTRASVPVRKDLGCVELGAAPGIHLCWLVQCCCARLLISSLPDSGGLYSTCDFQVTWRALQAPALTLDVCAGPSSICMEAGGAHLGTALRYPLLRQLPWVCDGEIRPIQKGQDQYMCGLLIDAI